MEILKEEIDKHQQIKITGSLLRSKFPTFEEIEPNISFLRSLEKKRGEENTIYSIFDEITASFKTETSDIKESIYNFYRDLYKKDPEDTSEQDQFLNTVNIKINENEKLTIDAPLGEGELWKRMERNKRGGLGDSLWHRGNKEKPRLMNKNISLYSQGKERDTLLDKKVT